VTLPVLGHQDARQVGVVGEEHPEEVEGLALHRLGPGIEREERVDDGVVVGPWTRMRTRSFFERLSRLTTTSKRSARRPRAAAPIEVLEVVDRAEVDAHLEAVVAKGAHQTRRTVLAAREAAPVAGQSVAGDDAWGGPCETGGHFGVPTLTATGTSGVQTFGLARRRGSGDPRCGAS
jgi:hypothetical protein